MIPCEYTDCNEEAAYRHKGEDVQFCAEHKKFGMFRVYICPHPGCKKSGSFVDEVNRKKYCKKHKSNSMKASMTYNRRTH